MPCDRPYKDIGASQESGDAFLLNEKAAAQGFLGSAPVPLAKACSFYFQMYHTLEPSPADIGGAVRRRTHRISLRMQRAAARSRTSTGIHAAYVENCKASM